MKAEAPTIWELESEAELLSPRSTGALVIGVLVSLYGVALLLIARRAMGAFTDELPWPAVLVTAVLSFAVISGLRILWRRAFPESMAVDGWVGWGASLTLILIAGGVSFPRDTSQDWVLWLPVLVADQFLRRRLFQNHETIAEVVAKPPATADRGQAVSGDCLQQIVRARDAGEGEVVRATLRADFVAGQRNATVYLGICPPLARMPEISITPVDGADVKIVQAFAHGARVDVRLAQVAAEAKSIFLSVNARG